MSKSIKVGLLPLYVALYDDCMPEMRQSIEAYYHHIAAMLGEHGMDVITAPICRVQDEFESAIQHFETSQAEAMITLHLAYSPSLESEQALVRTKLPIIVLDTTPDACFDTKADSNRIMYNHGIHGVQDMCNRLCRNRKPFVIYAGHADTSDVIERIAKAARIAAIYTKLIHSKVGLIGKPFNGMADIVVDETILSEQLGITVVRYPLDTSDDMLQKITQQQLDDEYKADEGRTVINQQISRSLYDATERVALSLRSWIQNEQLSAFTMNFELAGRHKNFPTMPFSEPCKAMARGIGYAGEGDVLTAALVGALLRIYPETSFAEMFCPNWCGNSIFFSHMGEMNLLAAARKPQMICKELTFSPGFNPTSIVGHYKAGSVTYVNIAATANGFRLILCDGEMLAPTDADSFQNTVSGWFRPSLPIARFLECFSAAGGTHHGALVYGGHSDTLKQLAVFAGIDCTVISD